MWRKFTQQPNLKFKYDMEYVLWFTVTSQAICDILPKDRNFHTSRTITLWWPTHATALRIRFHSRKCAQCLLYTHNTQLPHSMFALISSTATQCSCLILWKTIQNRQVWETYSLVLVVTATETAINYASEICICIDSNKSYFIRGSFLSLLRNH